MHRAPRTIDSQTSNPLNLLAALVAAGISFFFGDGWRVNASGLVCAGAGTGFPTCRPLAAVAATVPAPSVPSSRPRVGGGPIGSGVRSEGTAGASGAGATLSLEALIPVSLGAPPPVSLGALPPVSLGSPPLVSLGPPAWVVRPSSLSVSAASLSYCASLFWHLSVVRFRD